MPRITSEQHYSRYLLLRLLWGESPSIFTLLKFTSQHELHLFYLPAQAISQEAFTLHLRRMKRDYPTMVNRAGKHFIVIERAYSSLKANGLNPDGSVAHEKAISAYRTQLAKSAMRISGGSNKKYQVSVEAVIQPSVDIRKLALAFASLAQEVGEKAETARHRSDCACKLCLIHS